MKNLRYILLLILPLFILNSCEDDDGSNPEFGDKDLPHIYMDWQESQAYRLGATVKFSPQVSPSDEVSYKWTIDNKVISTEKDLEYKLEELIIDKELKFEVTRNGVTNHRVANLVVVKDFVPKTISKKSIAFLTGAATVGDINWENISHLVVSSLVVNAKLDADGVETAEWFIDDSQIKNLNMNLITTLAHHYGVYVMLDVSGRLNTYLNASNIYASTSFYNAATGGDRDKLIAQIMEKAETYNVDGINIYMNKAVGSGQFDAALLKGFYEGLAEAAPETKKIDGNDYDYLLSMSLFSGWLRGELAGVVNIKAYDWVNVLAFGAEDLTPGPHSGEGFAKGEVGVWLGWQGPIDPSRVVLTVPAFGLRYFGKSADYTWGNLGQYTEYISYRDLSAKYGDAAGKNLIETIPFVNSTTACDVTYYDGHPAIQAKVEYALSKNLAGVALWSIENDSKDMSKSLMKVINTSLGN